MRGDRPVPSDAGYIEVPFTPHARGSTDRFHPFYKFFPVYPACAGIDHTNARQNVTKCGLPRMRGDRPHAGHERRRSNPFTPHARGSTESSIDVCHPINVYPACAGIDLAFSAFSLHRSRLPRMRGDRPCCGRPGGTEGRFTPHARGSTVFVIGLRDGHPVYPACAGIDHWRLHRIA